MTAMTAITLFQDIKFLEGLKGPINVKWVNGWMMICTVHTYIRIGCCFIPGTEHCSSIKPGQSSTLNF